MKLENFFAIASEAIILFQNSSQCVACQFFLLCHHQMYFTIVHYFQDLGADVISYAHQVSRREIVQTYSTHVCTGLDCLFTENRESFFFIIFHSVRNIVINQREFVVQMNIISSLLHFIIF
uniref:Uncharacterized protein n=1 Tax=Cacopsylla melanoneura TaxID=428564 RepID=A0A8D8Y2E0_9HEMI